MNVNTTVVLRKRQRMVLYVCFPAIGHTLVRVKVYKAVFMFLISFGSSEKCWLEM